MKQKILLHTCCAHCLAYSNEVLDEKFDVVAYWHNPNILPYKEYQKRYDAFVEYTKLKNIDEKTDVYDFDKWFDSIGCGTKSATNILKDRRERCNNCYLYRLERTAQEAVEMKIDIFSTTLLYSIYQYHDDIKEMGYAIAKKYGINFYYEDFRTGWKKGFEIYKPTGLYLQNYCGCVFSEQERFNKSLDEKNNEN